jgi:hypothetical protein
VEALSRPAVLGEPLDELVGPGSRSDRAQHWILVDTKSIQEFVARAGRTRRLFDEPSDSAPREPADAGEHPGPHDDRLNAGGNLGQLGFDTCLPDRP